MVVAAASVWVCGCGDDCGADVAGCVEGAESVRMLLDIYLWGVFVEGLIVLRLLYLHRRGGYRSVGQPIEGSDVPWVITVLVLSWLSVAAWGEGMLRPFTLGDDWKEKK